MSPLKVFVSYAHKDNLREEVGALVQWLNEQEGIEAISDHLYRAVPPPQGWQAWMVHAIEDADVVLCICGAFYQKGFEVRGGTPGAIWEGAIATMDLYENFGWNEKYFPILPSAGLASFVPKLLRRWSNHIALTEREKILALIRHLQHKRTGKAQVFQTNGPPSPTDAHVQGPAFRNLQRETDQQKELPTFLRLRFAERAIEYVHIESVWKEFETFYAAPDAFLWWLIVGGAGTGKSRTALEFCEFLKREKQWSTGFLSLENTRPETWHMWCPQQDSLLVIDYVARAFSGDPRNIASIFTPLTRRAQRNEFGDKRIRILLLEREYKERNKARKPFEWYTQLDKTTCFQQPFELDTVSDEGLYCIARQTAKDIWKSPYALPGPREFLLKLTKLDKRKRPLFAMLLAGYLAKVDPKAEISPLHLLDFAMEQEFERSLTPAGVEEDIGRLNALLLATCTGGKLGSCPLPPCHRLWNSGLGKLREEEGENRFLFHPVEPDLLGERFVLSRAGGNRFGRVSKTQLKEVLQAGWREAPQEMFSFFSRCAQDFALVDSENIARLFLSALSAIQGNPRSQMAWTEAFVNMTAFLEPSDGRKVWHAAASLDDTPWVALCRAKATFNLVNAYGNTGNFPEARKLFEAMAEFSDVPRIVPLRAQAAFGLINHHRNAGNLPEARKLFEEMAKLGDMPEVVLRRAKAAVNLIADYGNAGNLSEAQKLFEEMAKLGETPEVALRRVQAAVNLMNGYGNAGNLPEARKLFEEMAEFGNTPEVMLYRAQAAVNLTLYCRNAGNLPEAWELFEAMAEFGHTPEVVVCRAQAAVHLMNGYANAGNFSQARKLFEDIAPLVDVPEMALECAQVAFNLMLACIDAENLPEARKLFEAMAKLVDTPEIALCRAQAAVNLIAGHSEAGNLPEARRRFEEMAKLVDTPEVTIERAKAAVNLVLGYVNDGNLPEARALFEGMAPFGDIPQLALEHAKAVVNLVLGYGNAGSLPEARKLFEEMAGFGNTPEVAIERAKAAVNLIFGYVNAGNLPEAQKLFEEMAPWGDAPRFALYRAQAAFNLILGHGNAGNLPEARKLFEEMAQLGDTPEKGLRRSRAAFSLMSHYISAGNLPEAQKLFEEMAQFGNTPEIVFCRAQATAQLILYYVNTGSLPEAQRLFEEMAQLGDAPEVVHCRAQVAVHLILCYGNAKNFPEARRLFADMATFGNTPEMAFFRAQAAVNLLLC